MIKKGPYSGKATSIPVGIGMGLIGSGLTTIIGSLMLAWLVNAQMIQQESVGYGAMLIQLLASAISGLIAWNKIKQKRLLVCVLSSLIYFLLLVVMSLPFGMGIENIALTLIVILLGGAVTLIPTIMGSRSGGRRYQKAIIR